MTIEPTGSRLHAVVVQPHTDPAQMIRYMYRHTVEYKQTKVPDFRTQFQTQTMNIEIKEPDSKV